MYNIVGVDALTADVDRHKSACIRIVLADAMTTDVDKEFRRKLQATAWRQAAAWSTRRSRWSSRPGGGPEDREKPERADLSGEDVARGHAPSLEDLVSIL